MRAVTLSLLLTTACVGLAKEPHPVPVRLEPVVRDLSSPVWELFDFLDTKVIQYRLVTDKPATFTAKITFRLRDSSGKLVETDHLDSNPSHGPPLTAATLTFLISPQKAFVSINGSSDSISTNFLQRVSGEYHYWKPTAGFPDYREKKIDMYAVYSGSKKVESDKTASIELEVGAEAY